MAPLDVGQTTGLTMGPCCQERGFLQAHLCQRNVRGSEPRTLHRVRPWMTCGLASRSSLLQVNLFFLYSPFFSFFPSLGNSRLLLARLCERQRQNSSLMGRLCSRIYACCFFERARGSLEPHYPDNFNRETVCPHERDDSFSFEHQSSIAYSSPLEVAGPLEPRSSL